MEIFVLMRKNLCEIKKIKEILKKSLTNLFLCDIIYKSIDEINK